VDGKAIAPRFDEFRPGTVAGVVDEWEAANDAVLRARASSHAEVFVVPSDEVLRQDAERRAHRGLLKKAYLALASSVSDQDRLQEVYVEEARAGHHMVVAKARDHIEADYLWAILRASGAHDGAHFGRLTVRELG
jgi:hypothetical protein